MKYNMSLDDLNGFIEFIGAETKTKGKDVWFRRCPKCGDTAPKEDDWKFSVNWKTGAFGCFRGSCGYHGHFVELCRDFGYKIGMAVEHEYAAFPQPSEDRKIVPRKSALAYLSARGISEETAEKYEVTSFESKPKVLWLPLFNEYGKLVGAKERRMDWKKGSRFQKEVFTKGSQPILFGMKQCEDFTTLVITEGLIDALSVSEAGIKNACSVPNGKQGFNWIPACLKWMEQFNEIVIFGDLENGQVSLVDGIVKRVHRPVRIVRAEDYLGEKDANDILLNFGKDAVRRCVENAQERQVNHVKELADVEYKDLSKLPKIRTGVLELDKTLRGGICFGQVVLLSGKRGEGKSTFGSNLFADALDQGYRCFAYSGELPDYHFKGWLNAQLAGNAHTSVRKEYRGRAFIYDRQIVDGEELESLTETVRKVVSQKDIKFVMIDNLMTAMDDVDDQSNLYLAQSKFVDALKEIAVQYDCVVLRIAHLRKTGKDEKGNAFDNDSVSGSSDITNRVDIVMNYGKAPEDAEGDSVLQVGKNRLAGVLRLGKDGIMLKYSAKTKRVFGVRSLDKRYGWERQPIVVEDIDVPF